MKQLPNQDAQTRYRAFCAQAPDVPLFMEPWYLDATCGAAHWGVALVEKASQVVAAWPYFLKQRLGQRYVVMPPLVRAMGPYALPAYRQLRYDHALYDELLAQLPPLAALEQDFPATVTNWLPFYWQGFQQTTRYSYFLPLHDVEALHRGLAADYRNAKIPKAAERVRVTHDGTLAEFWAVHEKSFQRQGMDVPFSFAYLQRLDAALAAHHARQLFFARDCATGVPHAVVYLVWDKTTAWYLLAGDDPALRASGAGVLLAWEAIRYAAETLHLPYFDFAGSMLQPIERVRRQFGAQQRPYFRLSKTWVPWWGWLRRLKR